MANTQQAEDHLRDCEQKRARLEDEYNSHQRNFPDDNRPYFERLNEHQQKLEKLDAQLKEAREEEHKAKMALDAERNKAREEYETKQRDNLKNNNGRMNDDYWQAHYAREYELKQQAGRDEYAKMQEENRRKAEEYYRKEYLEKNQERSRDNDGRGR